MSMPGNKGIGAVLYESLRSVKHYYVKRLMHLVLPSQTRLLVPVWKKRTPCNGYINLSKSIIYRTPVLSRLLS